MWPPAPGEDCLSQGNQKGGPRGAREVVPGEPEGWSWSGVGKVVLRVSAGQNAGTLWHQGFSLSPSLSGVISDPQIMLLPARFSANPQSPKEKKTSSQQQFHYLYILLSSLKLEKDALY